MAPPQNGLPEPPRKISALPYPLPGPPYPTRGGPLQVFPHSLVIARSSASRIYGLSRPLEQELVWGAATESETAWPGEVCGEHGE